MTYSGRQDILEFLIIYRRLPVLSLSHQQMSQYVSQCLHKTLTFDPTHDIDFGFSWQNFTYISGTDGPIDMERKEYESI